MTVVDGPSEHRWIALGKLAPLAGVPASALASTITEGAEIVGWSTFIAILGVFYLVRVRHLRLEMDERGFIVVNAWRNHYIPWAEVVRFEAGRSFIGAWTAHVVTSRRWRIEIHAIASPSRRDWRIADAVERLNSARERAVP